MGRWRRLQLSARPRYLPSRTSVDFVRDICSLCFVASYIGSGQSDYLYSNCPEKTIDAGERLSSEIRRPWIGNREFVFVVESRKSSYERFVTFRERTRGKECARTVHRRA